MTFEKINKYYKHYFFLSVLKSMSEAKKKGKKVGRPKKYPEKIPEPKNGISNVPKDPINYVEFLYDHPMGLKKLWQFFKLLAVDKIQVNFTNENIFIRCHDHHKKSHIRVKIDCSKINHYYCKEELEIALLSKNPELVMKTIDKTCSSISFYSSDDNSQKNINISLKTHLDFEKIHKIELIGDYDRVDDDEKFLDENYMIKFTLPCDYFKTMISNIKKFSDQVSILQNGPEEYLIFEYIKKDKKIKSVDVAKNSKLINLESNLQEDETFRVSFKVDYVKPVSSSELTKNIQILADENKPLMFIANMDEAIEIKILTNIIDNRNIDI